MAKINEEKIGTLDKPYKCIHHYDCFIFPSHWHDEIEVLYIKQGHCLLWISGENIELKAGEILFINSKQVHYFRKIAPSTEQIILQIHMKFLLSKQGFSEGLQKRIKEHYFKIMKSSLMYEKIKKEIYKIDEFYNHESESKKFQVFIAVINVIGNIFEYNRDKSYGMRKMPQVNIKNKGRLKLLNDIQVFVETHYQEPINLEEISKDLNISKWYLCHFIKETTGLTMTEYIYLFRIENIQKELRDTDKKIIEIAYDNGFKSIKTFNRVFKKYMGCTPSAFKETIKSINIGNI